MTINKIAAILSGPDFNTLFVYYYFDGEKKQRNVNRPTVCCTRSVQYHLPYVKLFLI